jgi:hypothetical protein
MRLNSAVDKVALVGRTIFHKGTGWRVIGIEEETQQLLLVRGYQHEIHGKLTESQLVHCRLYLSDSEIEARYPLILRAMRWAAILTNSEATACLRGYLVDGPFAVGQSEAVAHFGGAARVIEHALFRRHDVRHLYEREKKHAQATHH